MDIPAILVSRYPETTWSLNGEDYADLIWWSDSPKPTEAELEALWPEVDYERNRRVVELARARAYRETSDPIFFEFHRGDATEAEWLAAVQAVKVAHPYPVKP